jgi:hypothetical protein
MHRRCLVARSVVPIWIELGFEIPVINFTDRSPANTRKIEDMGEREKMNQVIQRRFVVVKHPAPGFSVGRTASKAEMITLRKRNSEELQILLSEDFQGARCSLYGRHSI